ncbi:MAG: hypothetical protein CNIPEHKO_02108 [Anaerolineales bacterium]|nr:hypothetical protein [Anaerolineales bacterium]
MKKANNSHKDDMLPEYNFKGKKGVRGKYMEAMKHGYSIRIIHEDKTVTVKQFVLKENAIELDPDVKVYFPDSKSVNHALRSLIELIPERGGRQVAEKRARYNSK